MISNEVSSFELLYDMAGKLIEVEDETRRSVHFTYSGQNQVGYTNADWIEMTYSYNTQSQIVQITDYNGLDYLTNEYDALRRVISQTLLGEGTSTYAYDFEGPNTIYTDGMGNQKTYYYDVSQISQR
ncbi:hypothetical protein QE109_12685 [Fusibacter bizertensis]|uniref:RHS repeat protein n=1 Tax=Fusibacter bizertensis TaxID=1488331 RepID=A0ABT6NEZ8_9FIRM|nr:hypothetical protein [Fusibacter bizertensis]MDH8679009.1 hypothetical protein [Fusibacter bizertensis]